MKTKIILTLSFVFVSIQVWADLDGRWNEYVALAGTAGTVTSEDYPNLLDNNTDTKWCVTNVSGTIYIEFDATSPIKPTGYVLTTAKDTQANTGRNPKNWAIKGRNSIGDEWTTLTTITNGEMPTSNCASKTFSINTNIAYRFYRFEISALVSGKIFQLSEFCLLINENNNTNLGVLLTLGSNGSSPMFADCPLDSVFIGRDISYPTSSSMGYSPFYRNTSLRSVHISNVENKVEENEFYGCTNLKNVRLGDGITSIGNWAFSGCCSLDYFLLGRSTDTIGNEAFSDCTAMTRFISRATVPPTCGNQALDDINKWNCILEVPTGSMSDYQTALQWKDFFFIEEQILNYIIGDVNKDGSITNADVAALINIILDKDNIEPYLFDHVAADINNDKNVSIADLTALVNLIAENNWQLILSETSLVIKFGTVGTLTASSIPASYSLPALTWSSSDETVATVDANGVVTTVAPGSCTITCATTDGSGRVATCEVTVWEMVLSKSTLNLDSEGFEKLTVSMNPSTITVPSVTWETSNNNVAEVTNKGLVYAVGPGTCTITCTATDGSGAVATCVVNVSE